ncbi:MAG: hypothetical protein P8O16_07645 [Algoriphagus sp.]|uniref:hypothetical protein n=1 Tax=Algoriphagus sp. TaxID=1872435 RepID=UPI00263205A1|nr:hypothetical protein [Algoriphagus sp.]MDG1277138.1 hypothetical protein [Algoriphagus sp.]
MRNSVRLQDYDGFLMRKIGRVELVENGKLTPWNGKKSELIKHTAFASSLPIPEYNSHVTFLKGEKPFFMSA